MAYSTSNPPVRVAQTMGGNSIWYYTGTTADSDVDAADFFSNGDALGMKVGDVLFTVQTDASYLVSLMSVTAVTAGGAATVAFGAVA